MESTEKNVGGRDRLIRAVLAVVRTIVSCAGFAAGSASAACSLESARSAGLQRLDGLRGFNDTLDIDTTSGSDDDVFAPSGADDEPAADESTDVSVDFTSADDTETANGHASGELTVPSARTLLFPGSAVGRA